MGKPVFLSPYKISFLLVFPMFFYGRLFMAFDIENGFLCAIVSANWIEKSIDMGIKAEDFDAKKYKNTFKFIKDYHNQNEISPKLELITEICKVNLEKQGAENNFLFSEFIKRKLYRTIDDRMDVIDGFMQKNDPETAYNEMQKFTDSFRLNKNVEPTNIFDLGDSVVSQYEDIKNGKMGVPLPWKTLNDMTMGLWGGTVTYFAGRPKSGKTTLLMVMLNYIWAQGFKVLVFSPEMTKKELAEKFFTMLSNVSATDVLRGTLSEFMFQRMKNTVAQSKGLDGIYIMDKVDDNLDPHSMEQAIDLIKPDIVFCDSIYKLDFQGFDESDVVIQSVKWMGKVSKKYFIPFVGMHQLSRKAVSSTKNGGVGYDSSAIALTDKLLWDANAVFLIESNKDLRADKKIIIHPTDLRRGVWDGNPVELMWDLDNNDFSEIEKGKEFVDKETIPF